MEVGDLIKRKRDGRIAKIVGEHLIQWEDTGEFNFDWSWLEGKGNKIEQNFEPVDEQCFCCKVYKKIKKIIKDIQ